MLFKHLIKKRSCFQAYQKYQIEKRTVYSGAYHRGSMQTLKATFKISQQRQRTTTLLFRHHFSETLSNKNGMLIQGVRIGQIGFNLWKFVQ